MSRRNQRLPFLLCWLLGMALVGPSTDSASAAFVFSNLDPNNSLNTSGLLAGFETSGAISVGFQVTTDVTLTSVEFRLKANTGSSATKDATLVLRQDAAGTPGATIFGFQSVSVTTSFQAATFTPQANTTLTAGSTYWLTLGTTIVAGLDNDGLVVGTRNPAVNPTGADALFTGLRFGAPDTQISSPLFVDAPSLQINGITAVPEPSICGAIGVALVLGWSRRRIATRRVSEELSQPDA